MGGFVARTIGDVTYEGIMTDSKVTQPPEIAPSEVHERYAK